MNVLWLKKDLRVEDHEPLAKALSNGPTLALFVIEPQWLRSPEFSERHLSFALESLEDLKGPLFQRGVPLLIRVGEVIEILSSLNKKYGIRAIYSHEETGLNWTFQRDLQVKEWAAFHSIHWEESRQFGVRRGRLNRDHWQRFRDSVVARPLVVPGSQTPLSGMIPDQVPWDLLKPQKQSFFTGGIRAGREILEGFLYDRGLHYLGGISSPISAFECSSRLSPYLTWGNISLRQVHHALQARRRSLESQRTPVGLKWKKSLDSFESRLWWHCHFIQKLETEPEIEFQNFNRGFDGLRETEFREDLFEAWCKGETGFPMIDACMRALHQEGWINFRMRAMLMSFAAYQLWLHWRKPAQFLAKQFVDFEPGIHFSQVQMQSGVTGINTIRIYSPSKQAKDQDPEGLFIKKYVPELGSLDSQDWVEPENIPPLVAISKGFVPGKTYPLPVVDPKESYQRAKERMFLWRKRFEVVKAAQGVFKKHGSRGARDSFKKVDFETS